MIMKIVTVCHCPKCDEPINVPIKHLAGILAKQKPKPSKEFMTKISKKRSGSEE